jgi:hypothetical protein
MSETHILIRLLTDVFSTELGIRLSFVKISEFWGSGEPLKPALGTPLVQFKGLYIIRECLFSLEIVTHVSLRVQDTVVLGTDWPVQH